MIPPRQNLIEDKERRFYIFAPGSVIVSLQEEALARGTDAWKLGGAVIAQWIAAGCPDAIAPASSEKQ
ncbi:hypothetical protein FQZ97_508490 [compost metagenome]